MAVRISVISVSFAFALLSGCTSNSGLQQQVEQLSRQVAQQQQQLDELLQMQPQLQRVVKLEGDLQLVVTELAKMTPPLADAPQLAADTSAMPVKPSMPLEPIMSEKRQSSDASLAKNRANGAKVATTPSAKVKPLPELPAARESAPTSVKPANALPVLPAAIAASKPASPSSSTVPQTPQKVEVVALPTPVAEPKTLQLVSAKPSPSSRTTQASTLASPLQPGLQLLASQDSRYTTAAWQKLRLKHAPLLNDLTPFIERAVLSKGTYYRLKVGPFANQQAAQSTCEQLQREGQACALTQVKI